MKTTIFQKKKTKAIFILLLLTRDTNPTINDKKYIINYKFIKKVRQTKNRFLKTFLKKHWIALKFCNV